MGTANKAAKKRGQAPKKSDSTYCLVPPSLWTDFLAWSVKNVLHDAIGDGLSAQSHQIQKQFLEAINLSAKSAAAMRRVETGQRMATVDFKIILMRKGWNMQLLAARWQVSIGTISRIANNPQRPIHWDDAVRGLPHYSNTFAHESKEA